MLKVILLEMDIVNNKGFSAIELLAIIIILTIVALISIPIVLNAVNSEKKTQNRKSVDTYGENIKIALNRYKNAHDGSITTNFDDLSLYLTIDNKVKCDKITIKIDESIHITDCYVDGEKVLNDLSKPYEYTIK